MADDAPDALSEALLSAALAFAPFAFATTEEWAKGLLCLLSFALLLRVFSRHGMALFAPPAASPTALAAAALLLWAAAQSLRTAPADALALASGPFTVSRQLTRSFAMEWAAYAAVLFSAPWVFSRRGALERFCWLLLGLGALLSAVGIAQQHTGNTHYFGLREVSPLRVPFGPFPNKNHAASFLALSFCAGLGLLAATVARGRRARDPYPADETLGRSLVHLTLLFVVGAGLLMARSRGAQLALGAAILGASALTAMRPGLGVTARMGASIPALGILSAAALYALKGGSLLRLLRPDALRSPTYRIDWIREAASAALDFPVFGVGLGAYRVVAPLFHDLVDDAYVVDFAHCDPLQLAVEGGIPLALALYGAVAWSIVKACPSEGTAGGLREVRFGLTLALGAVLLHQLVDFPSRIPGVQFAFVAVLAALWGTSSAFKPVAAPRPSRRLTGVLAALLALAWAPHYAPEAAGAYFDFMASRTIPPATHYYRNAALTWAPTFTRHFAMAAEYSRSADENPAARLILNRKALGQIDAALDREPLQPNARRMKAGLLRRLGRPEDARAALGLP